MTTHYLACDLGAESGRLMLGTLREGRLELAELHRFANTPVRAGASLHWDIPRLFTELKHGLEQAAARGLDIAGISTDSWGVDYLLFDRAGKLIEPVFHYRDPRSQEGVARVHQRVPWEKVFAETGIQFMPINTLYQLATETPARRERARTILGVGDGFNYLLSGSAKFEESMASTTQLYNPRTRTWSKPLLDAIDLPPPLFPAVVSSGTVLGTVLPEIRRETGLRECQVVASCSHDTGAAVAAVPAQDGGWAYLSSGTWSLMGVELTAPIINDESRRLNFTNEIGFGGSIRLLKNIVGLWVVQECRKDWAAKGREFDYPTLTRLAAEAAPFVSLIDLRDPRFVSPDDMPQKIGAYCRETNQPAPEHPGATVRCVLESLALLYRQTLRQIEELLGRKIERLHVVGGGCQNGLLNGFTANALQIPVIAGPVEATAAGNILVQSIALGQLPSLEAARAVAGRSFPMTMVAPESVRPWDEAAGRLEQMMQSYSAPEKTA